MITTSPPIAIVITAQFITESPSVITLVRRTQVASGAGGFTWANPVVQAAQTFRRIPAGRSMQQATLITNSNGKSVVPTWTLVCPIDANIERFDRFDLDGQSYEVLGVTRRLLFGRKIAEVVEYDG